MQVVKLKGLLERLAAAHAVEVSRVPPAQPRREAPPAAAQDEADRLELTLEETEPSVSVQACVAVEIHDQDPEVVTERAVAAHNTLNDKLQSSFKQRWVDVYTG